MLDPGRACNLKPFQYWIYKRRQSYVGYHYPKKRIRPCVRGIPNAIIEGRFAEYKLSGDRSEACVGKSKISFTNWGRRLRVEWTITGSDRGMYCRSIGARYAINFKI